MKGYSTFSKASGLEPHHQMQFSVIPRTLAGYGVLPLCRGEVGVFYSTKWTGHQDQFALLFTYLDWIHAFPKSISTKWNASSLVQDLNSGCLNMTVTLVHILKINIFSNVLTSKGHMFDWGGERRGKDLHIQ